MYITFTSFHQPLYTWCSEKVSDPVVVQYLGNTCMRETLCVAALHIDRERSRSEEKISYATTILRTLTKKVRLDVSPRVDVSKALVVCAFVSFLHCITASLFGLGLSDLTL
jgi:hypothetical protein